MTGGKGHPWKPGPWGSGSTEARVICGSQDHRALDPERSPSAPGDTI